MSSFNRLLSICAWLKPRRYHNWYLRCLLAIIPVLQEHSKFERMSDCSRFFIIEKVEFIEWIGATDLRINSIYLKTWMSVSASLKETQYP